MQRYKTKMSQFRTFFVFILLILILAVKPLMALPAKELSLKAAIDAVIANNPSLLSLREKINETEVSTSLAKSTLFPKIDATASAKQKKDSVGNGTAAFDGNSYNIYGTEINLKQTLFRVGVLSGISATEKSSEIQKLDAESSSRELISTAIAGYYQIILNSKNIETLLHQQKLINESLKVAKERVKIGRGQKLDVLQIQTQLALLDAKITEAKNQLQISAANLAYLMGNVQDQSFRFKSSLDIPNIKEIDSHTDLKNYRIPKLLKAEILISQVADQKRAALGQHLPSLALVGNYAFSSYKKENLYEPLYNSWYLGLELTIPIFSGFSSVREQSQYSSQQIQYELQKKDSENSVSFQQVTSRKNLESAYNSILSGEEALKLAIASLEEAKRNYKYAMIDFLQLLTVQKDYVQAEQTLNDVKFKYISAVTNYFVSSGQDLNQLTSILESSKQ